MDIKITERECSSRFKGVISLKSGKWGARISNTYKACWLGTFEREEEAALAYDRAAIKLQRSDAPLNFHWRNYESEECVFQSQYSSEAILNMIKERTYAANLKNFVSEKLTMSPSVEASVEARSSPSNERGIIYHLLFQKELTHSDASHRSFLIPREDALQHLPPLCGTISEDDGDDDDEEECMAKTSMKLTFYDKHQRSWTFGYSYWRSTKSFVFTHGWRHFLKMNNLKPKDKVIFYRCEYEGDHDDQVEERKGFYMIEVDHSTGEHSEVGNSKSEEDSDCVIVEETNNSKGVRLFGVQIG